MKIGNVQIGKGHKIAIQSMCSTKTHDVEATVKQILKLEKEGCDIIRVAVPDMKAAEAIPKIKKHIHIPLVADIHFNCKLAIAALENGADKIRINPGNMGSEEKVAEIIKHAKVPIRIGVNSGSLEMDLLDKYGYPCPEALVESSLRWVKFFEKRGFKKIVLSLKSSNVKDMIKAYELIAKKTAYPLHLGVTEAGTLIPGTVKSAIGIGTLLQKGIGDTLRVSLTEDPVKEVKVAKEILKSLGLYDKEPEIIACPTCGRSEIKLEKLAKEVEKRASKLKNPLKIAVMGCVVNGPGEARLADYGIAGGKNSGAIFKKGKVVKTVPEKDLVKELFKIIEKDLK
ncbi:MAG: flavodoxin-dependent (E)-4-hydroxy-3-methylbut-2-enyl-diphosphate synthase [Patescibacteria group bacterium]